MSTTHRTLFQCLWLTIAAWLVAIAATLATPSPAQAQADPLDIERMIKKGGPQPTTEDRENSAKVRPPDENPIQLDVQWSLRRESDNDEARDRLLEQVRLLGDRLGLDNHPYKAQALLREADEAYRAGREDVAQRRVEQARRLAPELPSVEYVQLALTLKTSPADVFALGRHLYAAYGKSWRHLSSRFVWVTNGLVALWMALMAFGLAMVVVVSVRHLGLLAEDLRRLMPDGVARVQVLLLLVLGILAPALLTGSLMVSAVVAVVLVGVYMTWTERVAVTLVLAALAVVPQIITFGVAGLRFQGSEIDHLVGWSMTGCRQECLEALGDAQEDAQIDARVRHARAFLRADAWLRRGNAAEHAKARKSLEAMLADKTLPRPMGPALVNNLGVAQAVTGDLKAAEATIAQARQLTHGHYGPMLNALRVLELKGDDAAIEALLKQVIQVGGDQAAARTQVSDRVVSAWFYLMPMPTEPLFDLQMERVGADDPMALTYWKRIGGDLPLDSMPMLAGGALALLWALSLLGRIGGASEHCPRCAGPMHEGREDLSAEVDGVCRACHLYHGGGQMSYADRVAHEAVLGTHDTWQLWSFRVGNVVVPGLGSMLAGRSLGVISLALISLGLAAVMAGREPLPDPWRLEGLWSDGLEVVGVVMMSLAVILSLVLLFMGLPRVTVSYSGGNKAQGTTPRGPRAQGQERQDDFGGGHED